VVPVVKIVWLAVHSDGICRDVGIIQESKRYTNPFAEINQQVMGICR
jgi:hypothetical protein